MLRKIIIGFCLVFCFSYAYGQSFQFKILKKIAVTDSAILDTLSIIPNSLKIFNGAVEINQNTYQVNFANTLITWKIKPQLDSVLVQYQTLPFLLSKKRFNKNPALIEEEAIDNKPYIYSIPKEETTIFNFEGFNKSGSISRGIGFGNNQDLAVNSNLVLQLSGKLNNEIEILAAISDDNLPIQPEGNTQQINDFDRVFIQLKRKEATLIAGDFELRKPDSYFANYFKRTQGILIGNKSKDKNGNELETSFAGAVAKGRSSKNLINGIENNQGPYRLTGNNGEQFIIVISGTERVFLDGILLLRGQDNDYVVDYNTAELTFTTKRLITRFARIVVEFEYSDKVFARSLFQVNQKFQSKKLKLGFNYYSEQDNPNRPFLQTLSPNQQQFLQSIGNQIDQAIFPNVDSVAFNENEILYQRKDTLGARDVYVYSPKPNAINYRVGFSFVGRNRGNYRINTSSVANGRVYVFVSPINGLPQGDYSPVSLLITPKKQQLVTLNADYKLGTKTSVFSEIGFSNNDANLYSDLQNQQNKGLAYKFIVQDKRLLKGNDSTGLKLKSKLSYEYVNQQFKPLERYRPVEFDRDFNFRGLPIQNVNEYWSTVSFQLYKSDIKQITYSLASFIRGQSYDGLQQTVNLNYFDKGYKINYVASLLNATIIDDKGNFLKQRLAFSKAFKKLESGLIYEQETNRTANQTTEILAFQSFSFKQYDVFIKSAKQTKREFLVQYNQRFDDLPLGTNLEAFSKASTFTSKYVVSKNSNSNLAINATYRSINYVRNDTINKNEETLLGRVDYNFRAIKGFLSLNSFYELGTGQEPKREFIYLEVPAAQGIYAWNDYNNNSIKELNEFEISKYPDQARYIKIFRPNNEFIRSNFTNINQTLTINPAQLLKNKKAKAAIFISKFSNITSLRIDKKVLAGEGIIFNPYRTDIGENNLISLNSFVRNTFFFNRSNPIFGFDINVQKLANKLLLSNGFDGRNNQEQGLRLRWNFIRKSNFLILVNQGSKAFTSQLFQNRNYQINYIELQPEFGYQFSTDFKTTFTFNIKDQKNRLELGGEKTLNTKLGGELRYNLLKKGTFSAQVNLINNSYKGLNNSAISYELLDGLQPGNNTTWSAGFQRTISNGIQLNFTYEGRKSNEVRTIHTGGLQVRAYF